MRVAAVKDILVSTHSRPKAAGAIVVDTNTPPKFQHTAARRRLVYRELALQAYKVSTHSRPKAADQLKMQAFSILSWFQHTAARRRLKIFLTN